MLNGDLVKMARLQKRMTQREFAELLGVSKSTISHVETGRRNVTNNLRARIAQELDFEEFLSFFDEYQKLDNISQL